MATDLEIRNQGFKYVPQQQYLLNPFEPTTDQTPLNQDSGIPYTGAARPYVLPYNTDGGGGGDDDDDVGLGNMRGKGPLHGVPPQSIFSQLRNLPTPFNLARKSIGWISDKVKGWQTKRAAKKESDLMDEIREHNFKAAHKQGVTQDLGRGWSQTNTGGGKVDFSGPEGQKHEGGWSNTPAGFQAAATSEASFAGGGRIGYNRGRVVNPGGYAGDEDGGILGWLKNKMGSESETNPTVFGTQNSLLNQTSIGQLENAIKSYEALMLMGELDEEQQDDYELKLNQLSALTEGATQKAHGGRVPFFYGGLATLL